jgi:hypothetical protein
MERTAWFVSRHVSFNVESMRGTAVREVGIETLYCRGGSGSAFRKEMDIP